MANKDESKSGSSAEAAYDAASSAVTGPASDTPKSAKPSEPQAPADKLQTAAKATPSAVKSADETVVKPKTAAKPKAAAKPKTVPKPKAAARAKTRVTKAPKAVTKAPRAAAKPQIPAKPLAPKAPVMTAKTSLPTTISNSMNKDKTMDMSEKFAGGIKDMVADAQTKAKDAFEKSSSVFGDYGEFAKGNVEAVVESGKILADGLQDLGTNLAAESRTAFEAVSSDLKEMATVKSPTDLLKIQSEMARKNFDQAVAYGSKNSEAMLKLVSDVMSPISSRMSLAVEKVRQTTV